MAFTVKVIRPQCIVPRYWETTYPMVDDYAQTTLNRTKDKLKTDVNLKTMSHGRTQRMHARRRDRTSKDNDICRQRQPRFTRATTVGSVSPPLRRLLLLLPHHSSSLTNCERELLKKSHDVAILRQRQTWKTPRCDHRANDLHSSSTDVIYVSARRLSNVWLAATGGAHVYQNRFIT